MEQGGSIKATVGKKPIATDEQLFAALTRLDAEWTAMSPARIRALLRSDGTTVSEKRAKALKARAVQAQESHHVFSSLCMVVGVIDVVIAVAGVVTMLISMLVTER